jgi:hypothetical protein
VAGSTRIVSAVGDGFCINVVRDVLKAALRAVAVTEAAATAAAAVA